MAERKRTRKPKTEPPEDGLVEVVLSTHQPIDGEPHMPGDKVRVTPERAAELDRGGQLARE